MPKYEVQTKLIQCHAHKKNAVGHSFIQFADLAEVGGAAGTALEVLLGNTCLVMAQRRLYTCVEYDIVFVCGWVGGWLCKVCDIVYVCVSVAGSAFHVSITSV